jgi:hypothetical protein
VYFWYCELLLESSVVVVELALQAYCNLVLKIIHYAGSGGVGLFYRKVSPHRKIFENITLASKYLKIFYIW